jgi:hypothetical protein
LDITEPTLVTGLVGDRLLDQKALKSMADNGRTFHDPNRKTRQHDAPSMDAEELGLIDIPDERLFGHIFVAEKLVQQRLDDTPFPTDTPGCHLSNLLSWG